MPAAEGPPSGGPVFAPDRLAPLIARVRTPLHLVRYAPSGHVGALPDAPGVEAELAPFERLGLLPPLYPEWLGDRTFQEAHGTRFAYVVGEMANGIAGSAMGIAAAEAGCLGFFGAAGLGLERIEQAIDALSGALDPRGLPWGVNVIHAPNEPGAEAALVDLLLRRRVRRASASAFMQLTPELVRYAATGLRLDAAGRIRRENHVFAKVSRPEVARAFLSPPPAAMLEALVASGRLGAEEARLAARLPVAEDLTCEADSGGHTDNRPLSALLPVMRQLRDELARRHGYERPIRLGAAGGLGTPEAVAAAFALGAAYVLTGSINQAACEADMSPEAKELLARAGLADTMMAPSSDMFEQGVQVQVLRGATLFGARASRLHELYAAHDSLEALPADVVARLEGELFRQPIAQVWAETEAYFARRDPGQLERAGRDARHRMALVFRWYLGQATRWAIAGRPDRRVDYQLWCGPAMGAFNAWVAGSFLEPLAQRSVAQIALNLLEGAAVVTRAHQLRTYGLGVPGSAFDFRPRPLA